MYEINMILSGIWLQFRQIGLYWVSGLVAGSLVSVFLSENIITKMLKLGSGKAAFLPLLASSLLGIVSPLCMYGTVPIIAALGKKGLPHYLLASFMVSSILLNPNIFLFTFALGSSLAIMRFLLCLLSGFLAGLLILLFFANKELFSFEKFTNSKDDETAAKNKTFFKDLFKALRITFPYLLIGITLSTLFERYVDPSFISGFFGERQGLGVLFATTISIPLYVCGGGTIPLIRAWMHAGMGTGEVMAFMLSGPALKINNISAVKMILGTKNFLLYLLYCILFAVLSGWIIEFSLKLIYNN